MVSNVSIATISGKPLGLASASTGGLIGLDAYGIEVEVCCSRGPSFFQMVGLAEGAVREARVRVASALSRIGVLLDEYAITINLAPADIRKTSTALDFAIAAGILAAIGRIPPSALHSTLLLGELSLDGAMRPVRGVLPQLRGARERGLRAAVVPFANRAEAGLLSSLQVFAIDSLQDAIEHLRGIKPAAPIEPTVIQATSGSLLVGDLCHVKGQHSARRALEVAAAGNHNVLMIGPPGAGKTMLARLVPTILPALSLDEVLETTAIHSIAGLVSPNTGVVSERPFRAPHHTVSDAGLVGGGAVARPGDVSLAHNGVLFLDELAEFRRSALEGLRQPLEDGQVSIARARGSVTFPARPMLIAAMNPCACGYLTHPLRRCRCSPAKIRQYRGRLSGPLLDRLDVHVTLPPVDIQQLSSHGMAESSAEVRERVMRAREVQAKRQRQGQTVARTNAALGSGELAAVVKLDRTSKRLIESAVESLGLSARAYTKILRVARTIADLERVEAVSSKHIAEAIQGRLIDRDEP